MSQPPSVEESKKGKNVTGEFLNSWPGGFGMSFLPVVSSRLQPWLVVPPLAQHILRFDASFQWEDVPVKSAVVLSLN